MVLVYLVLVLVFIVWFSYMVFSVYKFVRNLYIVSIGVGYG